MTRLAFLRVESGVSSLRIPNAAVSSEVAGQRNLSSVVYEKQDISLDTAVGDALAGAERAVRRTLQRRRDKKP